MTPPPAAPARRPLWGPVLVGCAIVGGLVILAGAAAFIFGMYWLTSAGRQYPTAAVASQRSQGVIRAGDLAADPGARALLTGIVQRLQEAGQGDGRPQLPAWIRNLQAQQARQGVSQWLPREATLSLEPDEEGVPRIVLAANMRGFVQPIRLAVTQAMKGDRKATVTRHDGREILNMGRDVAVCFMDGTLVVGYHPGAMAPAIDRLAAAGGSPLPADERGLAGKWDLSGWLEGNAGSVLLASLLEARDEDAPEGVPPLQELRDVRFGIDVESEDDARIVAEAAFASAEAAAAARPWLADGVTRLRERMESAHLGSAVTDSAEGDRVRYELRLSGIEAALGRTLGALGRATRERDGKPD